MPETITIQTVYEELKKIEKHMVTKKEIESLTETLAVLNNPETMQQLASSKKDIEEGRVTVVRSAKDLLDEM